VTQLFVEGFSLLVEIALSHVRMVLQWCYSGVTVVLQRCYSGVIVLLQHCYSGVTVVLQWCYLFVEGLRLLVEIALFHHILTVTLLDGLFGS
jgi:hypothetical protein